MSFNCRSIRNKIQGTMDHIKDNNIKVALVQETWLTQGDGAVIAEVKDYNYGIITQNRTDRDIGGGVAIIYHPQIPVKRMTQKENYKSFEYVGANIRTQGTNTYIYSVYRPPYSSNHRFTSKAFFKYFDKFIRLLSNLNGKVIVAGDFNMHWELEKDASVLKFKEILNENNFQQLVDKKTHKDGGIIDLLFVRSDQKTDNVKIDYDNGLGSDHYPITCEHSIMLDEWEGKKKTIVVRDFKKLDVNKFKEDLSKSILANSKSWNSSNLEHNINAFYDIVVNQLDKHCPFVEKSFKPRPNSPWFDDDLRKIKREFRAAERKYEGSKTKQNKITMKIKKNQYQWQCKLARSLYYKRSIENCGKNSKKMFKLIQKLAGNSKEKVFPKDGTDKEIAQRFANTFNDKISNIRSNIENSSIHSDVICNKFKDEALPLWEESSNQLNSFKPISKEHLRNILNSMNSKCCTLDPIPTWLMKECFEELHPILLSIINQSITSGKFPAQLRQSIVNPHIKDEKGDSSNYKNYRPVSNTPFLGKLLEKIVLSQLNEHLEQYKLHGKFQSGYRKFHSCETAMFKIINDIKKSKTKGYSSVLVLLDLSAAFDTIDHDILIERLVNLYGLSGQALAWIRSYLENRKFTVKVNGENSELMDLLYGVPQGSLLGPILFTMYIKQLERIAIKYKLLVQIYADDTQLYVCFNSKNQQEVKQRVEDCLADVEKWMKINFLQLNAKKTQFMFFKCHKSNADFQELNMSGDVLKPVEVAKTLGVELDDKLSMKNFISAKCKASHYHIRNLRRMKHSLNRDLRIMLVNMLIHSKLDYCNSLLANSPKYLINKLQRVQNSAIRFVCNARKREPTTKLLKEAHFLPVEYRIKYKLCMMAHKSIYSQSPDYICDELKLHLPARSLRVGRDVLSIATKSIQKNTLSSRIAEEWNNLSFEMQANLDTEMFSKTLKTYLFRKAFKC